MKDHSQPKETKGKREVRAIVREPMYRRLEACQKALRDADPALGRVTMSYTVRLAIVEGLPHLERRLGIVRSAHSDEVAVSSEWPTDE